MRKAAPRTDYMAMLDKRLRRMEDRVIKLIPKETNGKPNVTRAIVKPSTAISQSKAPTSRKRSITEMESDELAGKAHPAPELRRATPQLDSVRAEPEDVNTLQSEGRDRLPSTELQAHLIEIYFEYVYGQSYHLLHKPSFMRNFQAGTVPAVLLLAVCAVSARFSNHPYFDPTTKLFNRGEEWAKPARDIALKRYDDRSMTVLITYLLLGLHEFGARSGGRSWMLGGMALRMAYSLQLHSVEPPRLQGERPPTFTDREIERRTMWSCFIMDRMNSSGSLRPMAAGEKSLELALPIKEYYFQNEIPGETVDLDGKLLNPKPCMPDYIAKVKSNLGVAAYIIRLIAILGRVAKYLNLGGRAKDDFRLWHPSSKWQRYVKQLEEFHESLPSQLVYNTENLRIHAAENTANQFIYMHIIYNQIVSLLYRFSIPGLAMQRLPADQPPDFSPMGRVHAFGAAAKISELVTEGVKYRLVVPFSGYCAYHSSLIHCYGIVSPDTTYRELSTRCLSDNLKFLDRIKLYWGVLENLTEKVREHFDEYDRAARNGKLFGNIRLGPWLYGDWFKEFPHGGAHDRDGGIVARTPEQESADAALSQKPDLKSVADYMATLSPESRARHPAKLSKKQRQAMADAGNRTMPKSHEPTYSLPTDGLGGSRGLQYLSQNLDHMDMLSSPYGLPESYDRSQIRPQVMPQSGNAGNSQGPTYASQQQHNFLPPIAKVTDASSYNDTSTLPTMYNNIPDANDLWNFSIPFGHNYLDPEYGSNVPYVDPNEWMFTYNMPQDYDAEQSFYGNTQQPYANIPGAYFVTPDINGQNSGNSNAPDGRPDGA